MMMAAVMLLLLAIIAVPLVQEMAVIVVTAVEVPEC